MITFSKELYPQIALIKSAYAFTDRAYIHLDADDRYYIVKIHPKEGHDPITEKEFIFYGNLEHGSGALKHMGDNLTGEGEGDDEQIQVDLTKIPANVQKIAFTVTIYEAEERRQNFGQVSNAFIRIVDEATNTELIRYDLGEDFSIETAVVVGELYRHNGEWKFNAIGSGFQGGLAALCGHYGIEVA